MPSSKRMLAGEPVSPVGLGCMSLSQSYLPIPSRDSALRLLHRAIELGYKHFDTARVYGLGENEALISEVLATRRNEVFLATKCGIEVRDGKRWIDCSPKNIRASLERSLSVLGVDYVDLFYLHRRDFKVGIEDSIAALAKLKEEGKIRGIGLSEVSAETLKRASKVQHIDAVQSEYSLWTRNPELGVLSTCQELGTAFVAFSPVARGVLAGGVPDPTKLDPKDMRAGHPRFSPAHWSKNAKFVKAFAELADEANVSHAQLALYWVLSQGENVHVIPGTGNINHLEENAATLNSVVSESVLNRANDLINHHSVSGHRYPESWRRAIDTEDFETPDRNSTVSARRKN